MPVFNATVDFISKSAFHRNKDPFFLKEDFGFTLLPAMTIIISCSDTIKFLLETSYSAVIGKSIG
jgi:hypothetical protein